MAEEKDTKEDPSSGVDHFSDRGEMPSHPSFIGVGQEPPSLAEDSINNSNKDLSELGFYEDKKNDSTTASNNEEDSKPMATYDSIGKLLPTQEPQANLAIARKGNSPDDQKNKEKISRNSKTEPSAVGAFSVNNKPMDDSSGSHYLGPSAREARDSRYQKKINADKKSTNNDPSKRTSSGSQPGAEHVQENANAKQNIKSLVSNERVAQASQARYENKMMQSGRTETPLVEEQRTTDALPGSVQRIAGRGLRKKNELTASEREEEEEEASDIKGGLIDHRSNPAMVASPTGEEEMVNHNSAETGTSPNILGGGDKGMNPESDPSTDRGYLVEATLVNEDSKRDILVADAVEATPLYGKRNLCLLLLLLLAVAGISVGITCGTISCSAEEEVDATPTMSPSFVPSHAPTMAPTLTPTMSPTPYVIENLPPFTLEALQDPNSPQSRAYSWLHSYEESLLQNFTNDELIQKFALATYFYSTDGENWKNRDGWLSYDVHECDWYTGTDDSLYPEHKGNPCENQEYIYLTVWANGLVGTIPPEIGLLSQLRIFDASDGSVSGTFPDAFWMLSNLQKLLVGNSRLSGSLPSEIGSLTDLDMVFLEGNSLTGAIPEEFQQLSLLVDFDVKFNNLNGTLPSELGQLAMIRYMYFDENYISGTIPTELGELSLLERLSLKENLLSGTIPSELIAIESLEEIILASNDIVGNVEELSFSNESLPMVVINGTQMTGTVPETLCGIIVFECNEDQICGCDCEC